TANSHGPCPEERLRDGPRDTLVLPKPHPDSPGTGGSAGPLPRMPADLDPDYPVSFREAKCDPLAPRPSTRSRVPAPRRRAPNPDSSLSAGAGLLRLGLILRRDLSRACSGFVRS